MNQKKFKKLSVFRREQRTAKEGVSEVKITTRRIRYNAAVLPNTFHMKVHE